MTKNSGAGQSIGVGRFLRFSALYAAGDILTKSARVILVPYYLVVLTQNEVGQLAVLQAIVMATWSLLALGSGFGVRRFYMDDSINPDGMVTAIWWGRWIIALPLFLMMLAVGGGYSSLFDDLSFSLIALAVTTGMLKAGFNVIEAWFVIREEPLRYRTFTFLQFLSSTLLIFLFVSYFKLGVWGALLGELTCYVLFTIVSGWMLHRASGPVYAQVPWRKFLLYCLPMVPHFFFMWGLTAADRLILKFYVPLEQVGVYDVGYLLASFLSIFLLAMRSAWTPQYFRDANRTPSEHGFAQTADLFLFVVFGVALAGALFAPEVIGLLRKPEYDASVGVFRIAVLGIAISGIFVALNQPLLYSGRTGLISLISGLGLLVNVLANVLLIPSFGIQGAAWATIVSYLFISLTIGILLPWQFKIDWHWRLAIWQTFVAVALAIIGCRNTPDGTWFAFFAKAGLLLVFVLISLVRFHRQPSGGWKVVLHEFWRGSLGNGQANTAAR